MSWFDEELREVHDGLVVCNGLSAVRRPDRQKLQVENTRAVVGSCDVDGCLRATLPDDSRWDYAIGHREQAWFVEVHPAKSGSNFDEVIRKARWLNGLIRGSRIAKRSRGLHWVASGGVAKQLAFARKRRTLAEHGVLGPTSRLKLD